ncbi:unnamed protein product [Phaeothamnion confervicola]
MPFSFGAALQKASCCLLLVPAAGLQVQGLPRNAPSRTLMNGASVSASFLLHRPKWRTHYHVKLMSSSGSSDVSTDENNSTTAKESTQAAPLWFSNRTVHQSWYRALYIWALRCSLVVGKRSTVAVAATAAPQLAFARSLVLAQAPMLLAALAVLSDASGAGRQSSDTYKRLNLGIAAVAAAHFSAAAAAGAGIGSPSCLLLDVAAAAVALRVWALASAEASLGGLWAELVGGARASVALAGKVGSPVGGVYRLLVVHGLVAAAGALLAPPELLWRAFFPAVSPLSAGTAATAAWSAGVRAYGANSLLQSAAALVLKDGADRGRLAASTFRHLNLALTLMAAGKLAAVVAAARLSAGLAPALPYLLIGFYTYVVGSCGAQYVAAVREKAVGVGLKGLLKVL